MSNELGIDRSGNNNTWTVNNMTLAADQMLDSPTNNFCTWNPLNLQNITLSEGNLKVDPTSGVQNVGSTMSVSSGKWYWELFPNATSEGQYVGIATPERGAGTNVYSTESILFNEASGLYTSSSQGSQSGDSWANSSTVVRFKLDLDNNTFGYAVGNGSFTTITITSYDSHTNGEYWGPWYGNSSGSQVMFWNFGQDSSFAGNKTAQGNQDGNSIGDFYYTPPTGFLALCTSNLPEPAVKPAETFNTVLWTGNGSSDHSITGVGFQPDLTWTAERTSTSANHLFDAVRDYNGLYTNSTSAESDQSAMGGPDSDGFTVGVSGGYNESNQTYVAWNWKFNGSGSANTDGSINTTATSVNVSAGLSMSTYTGNSTAGATVGHGLSEAPDFVMCKRRSNTGNWTIFWNNTETSDPETDYWRLDETGAVADSNTLWNDTAPTATVFSLGDSVDVNANSNTYVAYCFHNVDGFSKMGYYEGNGNDDGAFIYTGFRPAWVMTKEVSGSNYWHIMDNKRSPINPIDDHIKANDSAAEDTNNAGFVLDFVSNGFKWRDADHDNQAATYIFMAFAETPVKYANAK